MVGQNIASLNEVHSQRVPQLDTRYPYIQALLYTLFLAANWENVSFVVKSFRKHLDLQSQRSAVFKLIALIPKMLLDDGNRIVNPRGIF